MQRVDPYEIALLLHYIIDNKQGTFSYEGGVTQVMQQLTGSPAEPFETTARRYAALPFAQQTLGNRLRAMLAFSLTPFYPAYNITVYERSLELPVPPKSLYCMQDQRWLQSHATQMAQQKHETRSNAAASRCEVLNHLQLPTV